MARRFRQQLLRRNTPGTPSKGSEQTRCRWCCRSWVAWPCSEAGTRRRRCRRCVAWHSAPSARDHTLTGTSLGRARHSRASTCTELRTSCRCSLQAITRSEAEAGSSSYQRCTRSGLHWRKCRGCTPSTVGMDKPLNCILLVAVRVGCAAFRGRRKRGAGHAFAAHATVRGKTSCTRSLTCSCKCWCQHRRMECHPSPASVAHAQARMRLAHTA